VAIQLTVEGIYDASTIASIDGWLSSAGARLAAAVTA
jgi:hypothetical protein